MARLLLSLLGPWQVTLAGEAVTNFKYDKAQALLAYLAVEADRPHRRQTLMACCGQSCPKRPRATICARFSSRCPRRLATAHQYEQALHYARRQRALEPWREEGHRQLMRQIKNLICEICGLLSGGTMAALP